MAIGPGEEIAGYRLEEQIGEGGMGVVYRARQLDLDRLVALKLIGAERRSEEEFTERFQRESRLAASIDHPNVVPIYQAGVAEGTYFIAMRFVDGEDLGQLLKAEGPLDPERATEIVAAVGAGLDAAHAAGLVHRDVKPANILLDRRRHVYLTDFGLTKQVSSQSAMTRTGVWYGALPYSAPEQIESKPQDARTDVYALGCVLFEALSGKLPYERESEMAVMWAKVHEEPARLGEFDPGLPGELDAVLTRALARDPEERYPSAGDLGRAAVAASRGQRSSEPERTVARGAAAGVATQLLPAEEDPTRQMPRGGRANDPPTRVNREPSAPRRWPQLVLGALAVIAIGALAAVAIVSAGDDGTEVRTTPARTVTEAAPVRGTEIVGDEEAGAEASSVDPSPLEPFVGELYEAEIPSGWYAEKDEEKVSGRTESQWRNPEDDNTSVLIDSQVHRGTTTAIEDAENVRAEASDSDGYREISFEPVQLYPYGEPAARWVFEVEDDRRVDYFLISCGVGYAVLGSTSPADFGAWAPTFHEVAKSVTPRYCE